MLEKVIPANKRTTRAAAAKVEGDDGVCCLSGDKPFFEVILLPSHVRTPYSLNVPVYMAPNLPRDVIKMPMVLTHSGKNWKMSYGSYARARRYYRFESAGWKGFVADNKLKYNDACTFELMESSPEMLRLRVVILRNTGYLPPELRADEPVAKGDGWTRETAIEID